MNLFQILSRLVLTGSLFLLPSHSVASAKSLPQISGGQSCRKAGEVSGTITKSFICTKVGRKSVWRKVVVQVNTTTTTAAPTTTTTTTILTSAPLAPSGLALTIKSDLSGTLSWNDNSNNEESFYVSTIDPAKLGSTPLTSLWGKTISASTSFTGLQKGRKYCFWVMASNIVGNSAWTGPACDWAGMSNRTTPVANLQEFVDTYSKSVVTVYCGDSSGSGVSISSGSTAWKTELGAQSTIATNMHVVVDCIYSGTNWRENRVTILHQGIEYVAYVNGWPSSADYLSGAKADLALIMTTGLIPTTDYWNVRAPKLGDAVVAIGSASGIPNITTRGEIAGVTSKDLVTTSPAGHGSSGGALFNNDGQLLGFIYAGNGSLVLVVPLPRLCEAVFNCSTPIEYLT